MKEYESGNILRFKYPDKSVVSSTSRVTGSEMRMKKEEVTELIVTQL